MLENIKVGLALETASMPAAIGGGLIGLIPSLFLAGATELELSFLESAIPALIGAGLGKIYGMGYAMNGMYGSIPNSLQTGAANELTLALPVGGWFGGVALAPFLESITQGALGEWTGFAAGAAGATVGELIRLIMLAQAHKKIFA